MKGIIFRGDHVLRILDGKKSQTRRLISLPRWGDSYSEIELDMGGLPTAVVRSTRGRCVITPRYHLGETLYCKETWGMRASWPMSFQRNHVRLGGPWNASDMAYRSDNRKGIWCWRSSMTMPEWASRCHIRIVSVKAQRLQDISLIDCQEEGIEVDGVADHDGNYMRQEYRKLWDLISPKHPWSSNPFVFVYCFKKV